MSLFRRHALSEPASPNSERARPEPDSVAELIGKYPYLFDAAWYAAKTGVSEEIASSDFVSRAQRELVEPSVWLNSFWLCEAHECKPRTTEAALRAYASQTSATARPSLYFDPAWYARYEAARTRVSAGQSRNYFEDYLNHGARIGYNPNQWFEEIWYREKHPEIVSGIDSGQVISGFHYYLLEGRERGHDPGPRFSERRYLSANPDVCDVARRGGLPCGFHHWMQYGQAEGRSLGTDVVNGSPRQSTL